jgi:hypothetical protein
MSPKESKEDIFLALIQKYDERDASEALYREFVSRLHLKAGEPLAPQIERAIGRALTAQEDAKVWNVDRFATVTEHDRNGIRSAVASVVVYEKIPLAHRQEHDDLPDA